jgi:hypothetical protein
MFRILAAAMAVDLVGGLLHRPHLVAPSPNRGKLSSSQGTPHD